MLFSDQVSILSNWFQNWNECEQTVALFSLLKRVKKQQAKFLQRCLEHNLRDCMELQPIEHRANDAEYIGKLISEPMQGGVISILLSHLPLLRPGNDDAKSRYLKLLPQVLAFAVERSEYLQESRQLLSYSLIHPAFDNDERSSLTSWMEHLDDRIPNVPSESSSQDETQNESDVNHNKLYKDDPALQKPETPSGITSPIPTWRPLDNDFPIDPNPNSLSPKKTQDLGAQIRNDSTPKSEEPLKQTDYDYSPWLKSLRLHKYNELFASMTYGEMLRLNEDVLVQKGVTKGARDKIILNVKKLHERFDKLHLLERDITRGGSLRNALTDLKAMIHTPIKPFEPPKITDATGLDCAIGGMPHQNLAPGSNVGQSANEIKPGDIPGQFTKVMGKACTQLLISKPDKENIMMYMQLLERCNQHAAFTEQQKKRLISWKSQVHKMYRSLPRNTQMPSQRNQLGSNYPNRRVTNRSSPSIGASPRAMASPPLRSLNPSSSFSNQPNKMWAYGAAYGGSNTQPRSQPSHPPIDDTRKTASLDPSRMYSPNFLLDGASRVDLAPNPSADADFKRLDSLSHSVAEHALAASDYPDQQ